MNVREASNQDLAALFGSFEPPQVAVAVCSDTGNAAIAAAVDAFDSEMLRLRIARVSHSRAPSVAVFEPLYAELSARLRRAGFDQLVRRVSVDDMSEIWALERSGFEVVDVGVVFALRPEHQSQSPGCDGLVVRPATAEDLKQFGPEMVRQPWRSRYDTDPAYRSEDVRRLRRQWLQNSLSGRADVFLVGQIGTEVAGYATGRLDANNRRGDIELVGTLPAFRRRGVASRILEHIVAWFSTRADLLTVRTQAANYAAANLYEKAGFMLCKSDMTFRLTLADEIGRSG